MNNIVERLGDLELGDTEEDVECPADAIVEIRSLRYQLESMHENLDAANALSKRNGLAYCSERAVSDRLLEALKLAEDGLGRFCGDEGWTMRDMDNWDEVQHIISEVEAMRKEKPE